MIENPPECNEDPSYITTESLSSRFSLSDLFESEIAEEAEKAGGDDVDWDWETAEAEDGVGEVTWARWAIKIARKGFFEAKFVVE